MAQKKETRQKAGKPQMPVEDEQKKAEDKVDEKVDELMRLYPDLEKMWITEDGFVHPEGVPEYCRKNAKLYTNKYFNK